MDFLYARAFSLRLSPRQPAQWHAIVGVTSNLLQRIWQHRNNVVDGFTRHHHVHALVWFELHETMACAISREKAIKAWKRAWKVELIEKSNPYWRDLYAEICD